MGVLMHNNILYGGGSTVEPNPQESATEQLEKLGIDGDVYDVVDANAAREVQETITEAQSRANLADGDDVPTIFGKIKKWFSDLKDLAFIGKDGTSSTKYLRGDGTWQTFPTIPTKTSDLTNDSDFVESSDLATVATSGSYNDLTNKPTIPAAQVNSDWNASSGVAQILNKPTIPTVNNGTLTIQKNGTNVQTFSANQSGNATANIECATPSDVEGSKVVTGNPLTITDAAGIKAEKIVIEFEPKQAGSGTPSPSNIRSITGYTYLSANRCGKNKLSPFVYGIGLNATNGSESSSDISMTTDYVPVDFTTNPNYYLSGLISTVSSFVAAYNANHQFLGRTGGSVRSEIALASNSFTSGTPQGTGNIAFLRVTQYNSVTAQNAQTVKAQLEIGSQPTQFEPYARKITIQLGQTLYGGKLTILQDGSADIDVDTAYKEYDGSSDEGWGKGATSSGVGKYRNQISFPSDGYLPADHSSLGGLICNMYEEKTANQTYGGTTGISIQRSGPMLCIYDPSYNDTDLSAWKTFLASNPLQIAYKLATHFTIHLSPVETLNLLQGINNVWTDGTTLSLTYQPDNAIGQAKGTAQELVESASTWKLFAESPNANIALPTNCKELYICVIYVTGSTSAIMYNFHILPDILTKATSYFRQGDYYTPDYFCRCEIRIRKTSNVYDTRVEHLYMNNTTDRAENTTVKVYYR